jgi:8-oxo-dGTP diphosphatase
MKNAIDCYIFNDGKVLLQKKARGFGEGKWNPPGGKLKFAESPERAAVREVNEETGLEVKDLKNVGVLNIIDEGGRAFSVYVFITEDFSGVPVNKGEGELKWFDANNIPTDEMWDDVAIWFPHVMKGKKFRGDILYSKGFKKMIKHDVKELE